MMGRAVTPAEYTADQKREAQAIAEVERTVTNIQNYKRALEESPEMEMRSILNALAGGYVGTNFGRRCRGQSGRRCLRAATFML